MKMTTKEVYTRQNKIIHNGFSFLALSYEESKTDIEPLLSEIAGRKITGISQMTLGERDRLIKHMNTRGCDLFRPRVPESMRGWKKGDKDLTAIYARRPLRMTDTRAPLVAKIGAILADMKLPWGYVDSIAKKRFNRDVVEFCREDQIEAIMQMLIIHQRRRGREK